MCLILFSFDPKNQTPLVVAANRDEFFARPSSSAHYWEDHSEVLAGRDKIAGGTWLGITQSGRFAAVTNIREPGVVVDNALSRGDLTRRFLTGTQSPEDYLIAIASEKQRYSGFNLLVGEFNSQHKKLYYLSNRQEEIKQLDTGTYGLSNHLLDSPWPKVQAGKDFLSRVLNEAHQSINNEVNHQKLRAFLENDNLADDKDLPQTGVSYDKEKALSAAFIRLPDYGTRTSTVLTVGQQKTLFSEKNYAGDYDQEYQLFEL